MVVCLLLFALLVSARTLSLPRETSQDTHSSVSGGYYDHGNDESIDTEPPLCETHCEFFYDYDVNSFLSSPSPKTPYNAYMIINPSNRGWCYDLKNPPPDILGFNFAANDIYKCSQSFCSETASATNCCCDHECNQYYSETRNAIVFERPVHDQFDASFSLANNTSICFNSQSLTSLNIYDWETCSRCS